MSGPTGTLASPAGQGDDATEAVKPRLRGVLHEVAFFVSLVSASAMDGPAGEAEATFNAAAAPADVTGSRAVDRWNR